MNLIRDDVHFLTLHDLQARSQLTDNGGRVVFFRFVTVVRV